MNEMFCPYCDEVVGAPFVDRQETVLVRGEEVAYTARVAQCPLCHGIIADSRVEAQNLERAYDAYRVRYGIPAPGDIKELRQAYGLSLREFSRFLGFGEQTIARYENGSLPDDVHANIILQAKSVAGARLLLDANRERLSSASIVKIEDFIRSESGSVVEYGIGLVPLYSFEERAPSWPCRENGYRVLDMERMAALASRLAQRCAELFKTKFQKAMYFCDALSFERSSRSLTGLSYAHADFGPVIDGKEDVMHYLSSHGIVRYEEFGYGEIVKSNRESSCDVFTQEELDLIDEVADFVDSFPTASSISEFSHSLAAWQRTRSGKRIPYDANPGELERAIEAWRKNMGVKP